ncbi:uncharacterized protein LOC118560226 isoform X2 [Fundulus heteroclitus]|uniref:uncharacterized protein LOC118560226 isoform X2 n=1 Tax=Fundulus heteroclitus TaxID=8078 RepID=UPI00165C13E2|nr:uncharacterized protein LOC118560226 isoform X2 [Fundulus heteroclitus]
MANLTLLWYFCRSYLINVLILSLLLFAWVGIKVKPLFKREHCASLKAKCFLIRDAVALDQWTLSPVTVKALFSSAGMWWLRCEMRLFRYVRVTCSWSGSCGEKLITGTKISALGQVILAALSAALISFTAAFLSRWALWLMPRDRMSRSTCSATGVLCSSHYLSIRWSRGLTVGGRRSWDRGPHPRAKELEACDCAGEAVAASAASWLLNSPWRTSEVLQRSPSAVGDAVVPGGRGGRGGAVCGVPGAGQALLHELQDLCWR